MDLGIAGKWALVCGASKGLGLGCAQALAAEGVNVVMVARGAQVLETSAAALAKGARTEQRSFGRPRWPCPCGVPQRTRRRCSGTPAPFSRA
ncbi:MAG: SDR family NAD(P)-dependent oxidoreductase, partial [Hydrogenophaga sp.]